MNEENVIQRVYAIKATGKISGTRYLFNIYEGNIHPVIIANPFIGYNGSSVYSDILKARDMILSEYREFYEHIETYEYTMYADGDDIVVDKRTIWSSDNPTDLRCALSERWQVN